MGTSAKSFVCLACLTFLSSYEARSIGEAIADARQSVNEVASRIPGYVATAADALPQYAHRVPQYVSGAMRHVPHYMERMPQYVAGAANQVPHLLSEARQTIPGRVQSIVKTTIGEVSALGSKFTTLLGLKSKKNKKASAPLVSAPQQFAVVQSPAYSGAPTHTLPMISSDYKITDGFKSYKSSRPIASPPETHAAAHAITYGAEAPPSFASSAPLYHNTVRLPQQQDNEIPDFPIYKPVDGDRY